MYARCTIILTAPWRHVKNPPPAWAGEGSKMSKLMVVEAEEPTISADCLERVQRRLASDLASNPLVGREWRLEQERLGREYQRRIREMSAVRRYLKRLLWDLSGALARMERRL